MSTIDAARRYIERGWNIVSYPAGHKRPMEGGWPKKQYTLADFSVQSNVGLKLQGSLVDIDLDCPETLAMAPEFLPATGMKHGRAARPDSHWWYEAEGQRHYKKYTDIDNKKVLLEFRASEKGDKQTMIPPSVHPDGGMLQWNGEEPSKYTAADLTRACGRLAAAAVIVRAFPATGRNELALALSGALLRNGWSEDEATHFVLTVFTHGGSLDPVARSRAVGATRAKLDMDEAVTGIPRLTEILGQPIVDRMVKWLDLARSDEGACLSITDEVELAHYVSKNNTDLLHNETRNKWMLWTGTHWAEEGNKEISLRVIRALDIIRDEAKKLQNVVPEEFRGLTEKEAAAAGAGPNAINATRAAGQAFAFVKRMSNNKSIESAGRLCQKFMRCDKTTFDSDPWLFNVANGTIDLKDAVLRPHNREDYMTRISPVIFDESAKCPKFLTFLKKFLPDEDTQGFVRRYIGYSMSASMSEQCLVVFWGSGSNGKSTLVETLVHVFGTYARVASANAFVARRAETQSEITMLEGSRFVSCSEPRDGYLDESLIKQMTGDNAMTVRGLFENARTLTPTWKAAMLCNNEPGVRGGDDGIWRRLRLVPFNVRLPETEIVKDFGAQLLAEAPGILNWCLAGCLEWQMEGLRAPEEVTRATEEYRHDMDPLDDFLAECVDLCPGFQDVTEPARALYDVYMAWEGNRGIERRDMLTQVKFGVRLRHKNLRSDVHKMAGKATRVWVGVRLNAHGRKLKAFGASNSFAGEA